MKTHADIKRTSVYIPLELSDKVGHSAKIHRRSFNQELLWLAEQGLSSQNEKIQTERQLNLESSKALTAFSEIKGI
jgi:hypothetical protein